MKKYYIGGGIFFILIIILITPSRRVTLGPGQFAPDQPVQTEVDDVIFAYNDFTIEPLAEFELTAKVLATKNYRIDDGAKVSPIDMALGWGPMSDEAVLDEIKISQSNRFYRWSVSDFPIPRKEIEHNSANMHLIPAYPDLKSYMKSARVGDIIEISGYLVHVRGDNGWRWRSSLTRQDTGSGACEVVFVEYFSIVTPSI